MMLNVVRPVLSLVLALFTIAPVRASGPWVLETGKGLVNLYGGAYSADKFINTAGEQRTRFDTLGTGLNIVMFGVSADYGLVNDLELNFEMPVGIFSLTSEERFPDRRIVSPTHVGIGATYQISNGNIVSSLSSMLKIPPGFHSGIYDDPKHPTFLSDGYFQLTTMLHAGFTHKSIWVKAGAGYNWRDEEPLDEIPFNFEIGLSRVKGTGIFVGCHGVVSTGDVTAPARPFYVGASGTVEDRQRLDGGRGILRTIDRENTFAINAGAFVHMFERIMISGRYDLRLFGRNTLSIRGASLAVGYRF